MALAISDKVAAAYRRSALAVKQTAFGEFADVPGGDSDA
jgi:hypothetical protein